MPNIILTLFATADRLLAATEVELERAVLRRVIEICDDPMRRMTTRGAVATELFARGADYDIQKRNAVDRAVGRAWKALEGGGLIEEPDSDNGRSGFRIASDKGRAAASEVDFEAAKARSGFLPEMLHVLLRGAAWNAFRVGDHVTALREAFTAVEVAVRAKGQFPNADYGVQLMRKAFDPTNGPLRDKTATQADKRLKLFEGAFGEFRNSKAHVALTITEPLAAFEEMMVASALLRIVDNV